MPQWGASLDGFIETEDDSLESLFPLGEETVAVDAEPPSLHERFYARLLSNSADCFGVWHVDFPINAI